MVCAARVAAKITNSGCRRRPPRWTIRKLNSILLLCSARRPELKKNYLSTYKHTHTVALAAALHYIEPFLSIWHSCWAYTAPAVSLGHYFSCARRRKQYIIRSHRAPARNSPMFLLISSCTLTSGVWVMDFPPYCVFSSETFSTSRLLKFMIQKGLRSLEK